ncbi:MAG: hypothetical protein Q4B28_06320 [bacterium]|nr:hypothetical protein [bacterium]
MVLQVENYDRIEDVKQTDRVDPKAEQEVRALEPFFLGKKKEGDPNLSKIAEEVRTVKNDVKEVKDDIKALRETLDPENLDFAAINSSMREHMRNAVDSY